MERAAGRSAGDYLTDRLTDEAVKFLRETPAQPFFLFYFPHYGVHTPLQAKEEMFARYEQVPEDGARCPNLCRDGREHRR